MLVIFICTCPQRKTVYFVLFYSNCVFNTNYDVKKCLVKGNFYSDYIELSVTIY